MNIKNFQNFNCHSNSSPLNPTSSYSPNTANFYSQSTSKINITSHAMQRIKERTDFSQKQDIKKFVSNARYKGVHVNLISPENCMSYGISVDTYKYIRSHFKQSNNSNKILYYKNSVFVFSGNKSRTLVTVVNLNKENLSA